MKKLFEMCEATINELDKFNEIIISKGAAIIDDRLENFEGKIKFTIPMDFKYILKKYNGISLIGVEIYGIDERLRGSSLDKVYEFEHANVNHKMPLEYLPFSPDGRGNHYCLDLSKVRNGQCPIVFWQWNYDYKSTAEVEICNENFLSWIKEEMIDWTLEDYNYDGTEKR